MVAERHEISLRVLKNISRVSAPLELFYDEFKVARLDFFGGILPKFEHQLRRHE